MPDLTLKVCPVESWSCTDEASLIEFVRSLGYEPCTSEVAGPPMCRFRSGKALAHDLWSESTNILEGLIPRLHCLFKFELVGECASVRRWTQETGRPWFDPDDDKF
jgi:hypothetical protein